ncbi:hypothetical protein HY379_02370 [Candidatus Saccharibacteria bacterium]|nr:hypothetical protein [Candidatus Saccharibacteria bacterium]
MNTAAKGRAFEHEIRDMFEREGYSVIRGAGSKGLFDSPSGVVKPDLVASKTDRQKRVVKIILALCKISK